MDNTSEIGPASNPLSIFQEWMTKAKAAPEIRESTAMTVSTVNALGEMHSRVVLCKEWSENGFVFFSNYHSRKGVELEKNQHAALLFYFDPFFKQIKISGKAEKTSREESVTYWKSRPRDSQISQFISQQSQPIGSRAELEALWSAADQEYANREIPCPEHWGGYLVRPKTIEFWIGYSHRLHDRFEFEKVPQGWTFRRLCP
jgi:pyridoxamine 5'-phosphate oxidase